jgi:Na+/proline symporter
MGHFIGTELPAPLPGLIVAAMLAALMSTTSSVVSSIATVVYRDGLSRLGLVRGVAPKTEIRICKALSAAAGVLGIGFALLLIAAGEGMQGGVFEINAVWGGLISILMAAFLLGVLVPAVSGRAMLIGLVAGGIVGLVLPYRLYYSVPPEQRISFYWVGVPAVLTALIVPLVLSVLWRNRKETRGLTLWTLEQSPRPKVADAPAQPAVIAAAVTSST